MVCPRCQGPLLCGFTSLGDELLSRLMEAYDDRRAEILAALILGL